jgi:hypothetical protein
MDTKSEVIGWLILDDAARVLVRKANGRVRFSVFEAGLVHGFGLMKRSP